MCDVKRVHIYKYSSNTYESVLWRCHFSPLYMEYVPIINVALKRKWVHTMADEDKLFLFTADSQPRMNDGHNAGILVIHISTLYSVCTVSQSDLSNGENPEH